MPGTRIVMNPGDVDPDPAPFLFISAEHKAKNAAKPYDPKRSSWVPCPDDKGRGRDAKNAATKNK
jgi:hypothetical protein